MFDEFKSFVQVLLTIVVQIATTVLVCVAIQILLPTQLPRYAFLYETPVLRDLTIHVFLVSFVLGKIGSLSQKQEIDKLNVRVKQLEMKAENKTIDVK